LPDNTTGQIIASNIRDVVVSKLSVNPALVSAAGTTQGTATVLTAMFNVVTGGTGGVVATASYTRVWNTLAVPINVYPVTSAQFDAFGTNIPVAVDPASDVEVIMTSASQGYAR
jgi:hypothetical protein